MIRRLVTVLLLLAALAPGAAAVEPGEILDDPALERRAREISKELRCLVCQNQSIDDSSADLARDLRVIVRERLVAGESDRQVIAFVTERYGDFVLLRPPFKPTTWLLWGGPAAIIVLGAFAVVLSFRRRARAGTAEAPLSDEEKQRLARLTGENGAP